MLLVESHSRVFDYVSSIHTIFTHATVLVHHPALTHHAPLWVGRSHHTICHHIILVFAHHGPIHVVSFHHAVHVFDIHCSARSHHVVGSRSVLHGWSGRDEGTGGQNCENASEMHCDLVLELTLAVDVSLIVDDDGE